MTIDTGLSVSSRSPPRMASPPAFDNPVSTTITSVSPMMNVELPIAGEPGVSAQVSVKTSGASLLMV
ncbi:MAG: hypothetical protein RLZZ53_862 [Acidobacteriota bacterium]